MKFVKQHVSKAVLAIVMLLIFFIGFFLDFIEITFIHVPVLAPITAVTGWQGEYADHAADWRGRPAHSYRRD